MAKNAPRSSPSGSGKSSSGSGDNLLAVAEEVIKEEVTAIKEELVTAKHQAVREFKQLKNVIGPGVVTGASDDDPSGIATYSITGAQFGFTLNWLILLTLPMMIAVQDMAGRIGLVTGQGLTGVLKQYYPRNFLILAVSLLVMANTINIGADLGAMGVATQLVTGGSSIVWSVGWAVVIGLLVIFVSYTQYARVLKYLTLSLVAYLVTALIVNLDWSEVVQSIFHPNFRFDQAYLLTIVGFLGTTVSPYLFFWQASEEVEERQQAEHGQRWSLYQIKRAIWVQRLDTIAGMVFSQLVAFFIVVTAAATLHQAGLTEINSAHEAALSLKPLAGDGAFLLFSIGIIGTGLLGVPILAGSAAYAMAELLGWREGLNLKFGKAKGFYGVIIASLIIGWLLNLFGVSPIKALLYAAVVNGLVSPILIFMMIGVATNRKVMGNQGNARITIVIAWITGIAMALAAVALLWSLSAGNL